MTDEDLIVTSYLEADSEYRLTLFLHAPQLRNRFIAIELNENQMPTRTKKKHKRMFIKKVSRANGEGLS